MFFIGCIICFFIFFIKCFYWIINTHIHDIIFSTGMFLYYNHYIKACFCIWLLSDVLWVLLKKTYTKRFILWALYYLYTIEKKENNGLKLCVMNWMSRYFSYFWNILINSKQIILLKGLFVIWPYTKRYSPSLGSNYSEGWTSRKNE